MCLYIIVLNAQKQRRTVLKVNKSKERRKSVIDITVIVRHFLFFRTIYSAPFA